ncbi:hypothetical protein Tco_0485369 [Tanacetum coccineum]
MFVHDDSNDGFVNEFVDDLVTLISRLDKSGPLCLHPNDSTALTVGKNKTSFIDGSCKRSNVDEVLGRQWDRVNAMETYDKVDGFIIFGLHHKIHTLKQNGSFIADYYHKLNAPLKQFEAIIELPKCTCHVADDFRKHNQLLKLIQFLMGLDDSYMQIRSFIFSREILPDVRSAYATISNEESYKVASVSIVGSSMRNQASVFISNVPNRRNIQRTQYSNNAPKPNNVNNNRQNGGFGLVCENCGFNGHTIDKCFKIIDYHDDFGKKKPRQNVKGKNISNNNLVRSSSSSGFTDEQMATFISLIKVKKSKMISDGTICESLRNRSLQPIEDDSQDV